MLVLGTSPFLSTEICGLDNHFRAIGFVGTSSKCLLRMRLLLLEIGVGHQASFQSGTGPCKGRNSAKFLGRSTLDRIQFVKVCSSFQGDIYRGVADSIYLSYSRSPSRTIFEPIHYFRTHESRRCISLPLSGFSLNFSPETRGVVSLQGNYLVGLQDLSSTGGRLRIFHRAIYKTTQRAPSLSFHLWT